MDMRSKKQLERGGWIMGSAEGLLELSLEETRYLDLKLALMQSPRAEREARGVTQVELAKLLGSSKPRIAKVEGDDSPVSVDALLQTLIAPGVTKQGLAKMFR